MEAVAVLFQCKGFQFDRRAQYWIC